MVFLRDINFLSLVEGEIEISIEVCARLLDEWLLVDTIYHWNSLLSPLLN